MIKKKKLSKIEMEKDEQNKLSLAFQAVSEDKTFKKLADDHKLSLVKESLEIGREIAQWVVSEFKESDPRKIATFLGVKVLGEERGKNGRGTMFDRQKKEIVVYRNYHEKLLREIHSPELSHKLLKLLVAVQLFYYLEAERFGEVYRRFKFSSWSIGPYNREKYVRGLSQVAAQAFSVSLLDLELTQPVFEHLSTILQPGSK
ncbi:MAG: hypothetical protein ABIE84_03090 [bacterium]